VQPLPFSAAFSGIVTRREHRPAREFGPVVDLFVNTEDPLPLSSDRFDTGDRFVGTVHTVNYPTARAFINPFDVFSVYSHSVFGEGTTSPSMSPSRSCKRILLLASPPSSRFSGVESVEVRYVIHYPFGFESALEGGLRMKRPSSPYDPGSIGFSIAVGKWTGRYVLQACQDITQEAPELNQRFVFRSLPLL